MHRRGVRVQGFNSSSTFLMDGHAIALGTRHPGSRRPMVVAYDLKARRSLWVRSLVTDVTAPVKERPPQHASVAGGRVVLDYQLGKEDHRLTALDASTGEPQWDVRLPLTGFSIKKAADAIVASPSRVYVVSGGIIMVFDAATGKQLGEVSETEE